MQLQHMSSQAQVIGPLQAYETLSLLEGTSSCTEAAISSGTRLRSEDLKDLSYYFNKVR